MPKTVDGSDGVNQMADLVSCCQQLYKLVKEQGSALSVKDFEKFNRLSREIELVQEKIQKKVTSTLHVESWGVSRNHLNEVRVILEQSNRENQQNIRLMQDLMGQLKRQIRNVGRLEKYIPQDNKRQGRIIDRNV